MNKPKQILFFVTLFFITSCGQQPNKKQSETTIHKNISTTVSTDTTKLAKLIKLSTYKPLSATFKYTLINNSGTNDRMLVPGPSDAFLEAVLHFDPTTFQHLKSAYYNIDYTDLGYNKQEFNFDWLDTSIKKELLQTDTLYNGHPDYFFGLGPSGKLWMLDNKLLLVKRYN